MAPRRSVSTRHGALPYLILWIQRDGGSTWMAVGSNTPLVMGPWTYSRASTHANLSSTTNKFSFSFFFSFWLLGRNQRCSGVHSDAVGWDCMWCRAAESPVLSGYLNIKYNPTLYLKQSRKCILHEDIKLLIGNHVKI